MSKNFVFLILLFWLFWLIALPKSVLAQTSLFPVVEGNRWGYINENGEVKIPFRFENALSFSEELAPVRQNGRFGYINAQGRFVLPPTYDYAMPFSNGIARIWKDSKPYLIDRKGNILFEHNFEEFRDIKFGAVVVKNHFNKFGMVDLQGKTILEPQYASIFLQNDGLFYISKRVEGIEEWKGIQTVMDSTLHFIVPLGKFQSIKEFSDGLALVEFEEGEATQPKLKQGVIDLKGNLVYTAPDSVLYMSSFSDGLASVSICQKEDCADVVSRYKTNYEGIINTKGEFVLHDRKMRNFTPFRYGRSFMSMKDADQYYRLMIDTKGNIITNTRYWQLSGNGFDQGQAVVKRSENHWSVIDTLGNVSFNFEGENIHYVQVSDSYFLIEHQSPYLNKYVSTWSVVNRRGKMLVSQNFQSAERGGFKNGLLYVKTLDESGYINEEGEWIWKMPHTLAPLNIDFMREGAYAATSLKEYSADRGLGGNAKSNHVPMQLPADHNFEKRKVSVVIRPNEKAIFGRNIEGMKLYIVNATFFIAYRFKRYPEE
jgi:hypothetical protein